MYRTIGISKQAVHRYEQRQLELELKMIPLIRKADKVRKKHPGCGVEKLYSVLNPSFLGRDRFIEIMMALGYRLKKKPNYKRTTTPGTYYYPNLIQGLTVNRPGQVW